jgi:hypothetical protein
MLCMYTYIIRLMELCMYAIFLFQSGAMRHLNTLCRVCGRPGCEFSDAVGDVALTSMLNKHLKIKVRSNIKFSYTTVLCYLTHENITKNTSQYSLVKSLVHHWKTL